MQASAGLIADARKVRKIEKLRIILILMKVVKRARNEASNFRFMLNEAIPIEVTVMSFK